MDAGYVGRTSRVVLQCYLLTQKRKKKTPVAVGCRARTLAATESVGVLRIWRGGAAPISLAQRDGAHRCPGIMRNRRRALVCVRARSRSHPNPTETVGGAVGPVGGAHGFGAREESRAAPRPARGQATPV